MTLAAPPPRLPAKPAIVELKLGLRLLRFFDPGRGPWHTRRSYGPLDAIRFDHHLPPSGPDPERAVWYAATSLRGAVAEAFGRTGIVDRDARTRLVVATVTASIAVLDLVGVAARRAGLTQEIAATTDYDICQAWARAFYEQYLKVQGIRWRGRQAGSISVVLNDRAPMRHLEGRDYALRDPRVWPRVARAAHDCSLTIV